jgi:hypothetical protein
MKSFMDKEQAVVANDRLTEVAEPCGGVSLCGSVGIFAKGHQHDALAKGSSASSNAVIGESQPCASKQDW